MLVGASCSKRSERPTSLPAAGCLERRLIALTGPIWLSCRLGREGVRVLDVVGPVTVALSQ